MFLKETPARDVSSTPVKKKLFQIGFTRCAPGIYMSVGLSFNHSGTLLSPHSSRFANNILVLEMLTRSSCISISLVQTSYP